MNSKNLRELIAAKDFSENKKELRSKWLLLSALTYVRKETEMLEDL